MPTRQLYEPGHKCRREATYFEFIFFRKWISRCETIAIECSGVRKGESLDDRCTLISALLYDQMCVIKTEF